MIVGLIVIVIDAFAHFEIRLLLVRTYNSIFKIYTSYNISIFSASNYNFDQGSYHKKVKDNTFIAENN
jgi:hypothetical protein